MKKVALLHRPHTINNANQPCVSLEVWEQLNQLDDNPYELVNIITIAENKGEVNELINRHKVNKIWGDYL